MDTNELSDEMKLLYQAWYLIEQMPENSRRSLVKFLIEEPLKLENTWLITNGLVHSNFFKAAILVALTLA